MTPELITILTLGIIIIKVIWIRTEIKFSKERINFDMIKTNFVEAAILFLQILAAIFTPLPQTPWCRHVSWWIYSRSLGKKSYE